MSKLTLALLSRTLVCTAVLSGAALSFSSLATAAEHPSRQLTVKYSADDLANDERVAALYQRLQSAARQVCSTLKGKDLESMRNYRACYTETLTDAIGSINEQALTAHHNKPDAKSARARSSSESAS